MITTYLTDVIAGLEERVARLRELEAALAEVDDGNIIILGVRLDTDSLPNGVELVTAGDMRAVVFRGRERWIARGGRGGNWLDHLPIVRDRGDGQIDSHDGETAAAAVTVAVEWLTMRAASSRQATP